MIHVMCCKLHVLLPITGISPFPPSLETTVAFLRESYTFVSEGGSVSQRMCFEFRANFIECLVAQQL